MKYFAVIIDDKVDNTIVAETKEIAEEASGYTCIEYDNTISVFKGCLWDGENFIPPETNTI